ncbi:hypothetical protein NIB75_18730 [Bacteroides uniformis]|nr:hypothetical protein [Bacteroides uniformis]
MKENKPCLLLLNDIHISKDNIPAFQANWQEAMGICRERDIREVVVGGDLFFSRAAQTLDVLLAVGGYACIRRGPWHPCHAGGREPRQGEPGIPARILSCLRPASECDCRG